MGETPEQPNTETVIAPEGENERFHWYAVITQSGMEKRSKEALEERIKKTGLSEYFGKVEIPSVPEEYIDASGKKRVREKKLMPGYIIIQMEMNDKTFSCVRDTPKISNFVGLTGSSHGKMPMPMRDEEVSRLLNREAQVAREQASRPKLSYEKGDRVKVIDGPFTNFVGDVDEVKADKQKLRLLISVFGRPTPVEIEFSKVEKVTTQG